MGKGLRLQPTQQACIPPITYRTFSKTQGNMFNCVSAGIAAIAGSALVAVAAAEAIDAPFLQVRQLMSFLDQRILLFINFGSNFLPSLSPNPFIYSGTLSTSSDFSFSPTVLLYIYFCSDTL